MTAQKLEGEGDEGFCCKNALLNARGTTKRLLLVVSKIVSPGEPLFTLEERKISPLRVKKSCSWKRASAVCSTYAVNAL